MSYRSPTLPFTRFLYRKMEEVLSNIYEQQNRRSDFYSKPPLWLGRSYNQGQSAVDEAGTSVVSFITPWDCHDFEVCYGNWVNAGAGEVASGLSDITITGVFEYPNGTRYDLVFPNGTYSYTLRPYERVKCRPIGLNIVANTKVRVRTFATCAAGGKLPLGPAASNINSLTPGDGVNYLGGGTPGDQSDQTHTATAMTSGNDFCYGPYEIQATPNDGERKPIVGIAGDSIPAGNGNSSYWDYGPLGRAFVGNVWGITYRWLPRASESSDMWVFPKNRMRTEMMSSCDFALCNYITNAIWLEGKTAAQTITAIDTASADMAQRVWTGKVYWLDCLPRTTGTQTATSTQVQDATFEPIRLEANRQLRAGACGCIESIINWSNAVEVNVANVFKQGGGYWWCQAGNNVAISDGTHPIGGTNKASELLGNYMKALINDTKGLFRLYY